jgi:tRNA A37 threonylcarbamoyladenosine synthetase subunit TsaC/SUA5/YrdC
MLFLDGKGAKKTKKRNTVGCRMPNDPVALAILQQLDTPLLVSSVPAGEEVDHREEEEGDENEEGWNEDGPEGAVSCMGSASSGWFRSVDFVVDAGQRPAGGSTIFDLMEPDEGPVLVRKGLGSTELKF